MANGYTREIIYCEEDDSVTLEVEFYGDVKMIDHGIGPYEFWGCRGCDRDLRPTCDDVQWDKTIYTDDENNAIERHLERNIENIIEYIEASADFSE